MLLGRTCSAEEITPSYTITRRAGEAEPVGVSRIETGVRIFEPLYCSLELHSGALQEIFCFRRFVWLLRTSIPADPTDSDIWIVTGANRLPLFPT